MTLKLKKTVSLSEKPKALIKRGGDVWYAGGESGKLKRLEVGTREEKEESVLPDFSRADGGMTQRDNQILTATASDRLLFATDIETKERRQLLDFKTLEGGVRAAGIRAKNSEISDIAWNDDTLWVAVSAGYSSCIVQIDVEKKKIVKDFWSPGPKPFGLDFDSDNRLWVLEGRMNGLVSGNKNGEWQGEGDRLPLPAVRYLSIDASDNFWTTDATTSQIFCVRKEG